MSKTILIAELRRVADTLADASRFMERCRDLGADAVSPDWTWRVDAFEQIIGALQFTVNNIADDIDGNHFDERSPDGLTHPSPRRRVATTP